MKQRSSLGGRLVCWTKPKTRDLERVSLGRFFSDRPRKHARREHSRRSFGALINSHRGTPLFPLPLFVSFVRGWVEDVPSLVSPSPSDLTRQSNLYLVNQQTRVVLSNNGAKKRTATGGNHMLRDTKMDTCGALEKVSSLRSFALFISEALCRVRVRSTAHFDSYLWSVIIWTRSRDSCSSIDFFQTLKWCLIQATFHTTFLIKITKADGFLGQETSSDEYFEDLYTLQNPSLLAISKHNLNLKIQINLTTRMPH